MWIRLKHVELNDNIVAEVIVEFDCSSRGCPGDYFNPPEGPEFEITGCYVEFAETTAWAKSRDEMGELWAAILDKRLDEIVDSLPDLYELQYDEFHYGGDY